MLKALFKIAFVASLMTLAASGVAFAHVEISPSKVPEGSTREFVVEAPNESDVPFDKLEIRIPDGFEATGANSPSGFKGQVQGNSVVWSGGSVPAGEEQAFAFQARVPRQAGEFTFEAIQTYRDGEVVRWAGPEDSNEPAPVVTVTESGNVSEAGDEHQHGDEGHSHGAAMPDTGGPIVPLAALGAAMAAAGVALLAVYVRFKPWR